MPIDKASQLKQKRTKYGLGETPRRNTSEKHLGEIVPKKYAEEIRRRNTPKKYALKKNTTLKRKK